MRCRGSRFAAPGGRGGPGSQRSEAGAARRAAVLKGGGSERVLRSEPGLETCPRPRSRGGLGPETPPGCRGARPGLFSELLPGPYSRKVAGREPRGFQKKMEKELGLVLSKISDPGAFGGYRGRRRSE